MKFPDYEEQLKAWVSQHLEITDEPVVLAIYYNVREHPKDVYLLEIAKNFGFGTVSDEGDFFETVYGPAAGFPVSDSGHLHLILSNPEEFLFAKDLGWPTYKAIKRAVRNGEYKIIYKSETGLPEQYIGWLKEPEEIVA